MCLPVKEIHFERPISHIAVTYKHNFHLHIPLSFTNLRGSPLQEHPKQNTSFISKPSVDASSYLGITSLYQIHKPTISPL